MLRVLQKGPLRGVRDVWYSAADLLKKQVSRAGLEPGDKVAGM